MPIKRHRAFDELMFWFFLWQVTRINSRDNSIFNILACVNLEIFHLKFTCLGSCQMSMQYFPWFSFMKKKKWFHFYLDYSNYGSKFLPFYACDGLFSPSIVFCKTLFVDWDLRIMTIYNAYGWYR